MNTQNKINYNVNQTKEDIEQKSKLPTNDIVFHELFGQRGNEEIVRKFIEKIFTDYFELHVIELQKYVETRTKENKDELLDVMANQKRKGGRKEMEENIWLDFLVNPECEAVAKAMETDEELRIVYKKWKEIMADEELRERARRLEYAEYDRNTELEEAINEGLEQRKGATE